MRAFKVFIFGLLYGWFIKVAFDRIFRDNDIEDVLSENVSLKDYIQSLEAQLQSRSSKARPAQQAMSAPTLTETPAPAARAERDNLKVIRGIGPAIEKKLNDAGIYTFAALSRLSTAELEGILGNQVRRLQNENDLIAQARELAEQNRAG